MNVHEYVTSPTGTIHLIKASAFLLVPQPSTLCGLVYKPHLWGHGDETVSGLAATCNRCRQIFRKIK